MSKKKRVHINEAKGRPMLHWVGKRPLDYVTTFPAQLLETFNPIEEENDFQGLLFHGDNKDIVAWLIANGYRGKVDLIYIDPPFDSGADYIRQVQLRGVSEAKVDGEGYTLGEQIQYTDIWVNDAYLQFMYERLLLLRELLADNGSILLHCDPNRVHHLRCLMEEIFGNEKTFKNEIIWFYRRWPTNTPTFQTMHDNILWFTKCTDNSHTFHQLYEEPSERTLSDYGGKRLTTIETEEGSWVKRETDEESPGVPLRDVWEIRREHPRGHEHTDYPTQKPVELIERLLLALSSPGDLVLDCFVGAGTTAVVAQKLGRRWIAADINKGAIQTTSKRLQTIIRKQLEESTETTQPVLELGGNKEEDLSPVSLSFSIYRVNDYDLQVQHNEAANLAVELIGIECIKTDTFFDGTLGKRLAKINPFTHPLTLMDLQLIKDELDVRPKEERDIVIVCLGKELTVDSWLEEYNKNRPINRMEIIELRTDEKYGKFFIHQPVEAQVEIERQEDKIIVNIEEFISPAIVERLEMDMPLFRKKIPDWRAMVDVVMIDTAYDGEIFDIDLSDVPERKDDLVVGTYKLDAPAKKTTVAVKIIDMLGEEVLVTKRL